MRRTLLPKALALALGVAAWNLLPWPASGLACAAILVLAMAVLLVPVFDPRSSVYVPTVSAARGGPPRVALTFDDGPDPRFTPKILDLLDEAGVRAAFFVVGARAEAHPELVRAIRERGHVVGNHTYRHGLDFHFGGPRAITRDLDAFDAALAPTLGAVCRFFRAPQGFRTPLLADVLRTRELVCVGWSARGFDSVSRAPDAIVERVRRGLVPGGIVLLHDGAGLGGSHDRSATLAALPEVIAEARRRGLELVRLDELLGIEAYRRLDGTG